MSRVRRGSLRGVDFSPSGLAVNLIVRAIGFGILGYGKKQQRIPQTLAGLALMIYPYFVGGALLMGGIGVGIVAALGLLSW